MTANTAASKKEKGSRLERPIAGYYRKYLGFSKSSRMPLSGAISTLQGDILKMDDRGRRVDLEYVDECKNAETIKLTKWLQQTISQAPNTKIPVLHMSSNYRPLITIVEEAIWADWYNLNKWTITECNKKSISFWKEWDIVREDAASVMREPVLLFWKLGRQWAAINTETYFKMRKETIKPSS